MLLRIVYSFLGSLGFGILFNIRNRNLIFASLGGALAWLSYETCMNFTFGQSVSLFIASITFSIYSEIMATIRKQPVTIFVISAMIPLVPGSGMYYSMYESVKGNTAASITVGIQTLFYAGSLAVGVILVSSIAKILRQKKLKRS